MSRAQTLIDSINAVLTNDKLEEKGVKTGRFHVHVTSHDGGKLFSAHANTGDEVHSVLNRAAKHMKDAGMPKIRAKVHDTFANKDYKHTASPAADGSVHFDGPDPRKYATA